MSSDTAITVDHVSKAYRIGVKDRLSDTFVGAALAVLKSPVENFHRLRRLNTFDSTVEEEDAIWALKEVSFEVRQGEVLGIIGRNGAGKSTLLKIISRITEPTAGRLTMRGRVASLLEVGTGFHPDLTGRENIYMNGIILGMRKREIDRKFDEIVAFSGVEKFIYTPVKRYSSGMKVRLAFSVAANLESDILIVDEVLAVGDAEFQRRCLGKMDEVSRSGRTVLFVSHNMSAVAELTSHLLLLDRGELVSNGVPRNVINEYLGMTRSRVGTHYLLEKTARREPSRGAILLEAAIIPGEPSLNRPLAFGEPFAVHMHWLVCATLRGLVILCEIKDELDRLVFMTTSQDLSPELLEQAGEKKLCCSVNPNILKPGAYRVNLFASIHSRARIGGVETALAFQVGAYAYKEDHAYRSVEHALVAPPVQWSIAF